jgi:hypothetical protein
LQSKASLGKKFKNLSKTLPKEKQAGGMAQVVECTRPYIQTLHCQKIKNK